MNIKDMERVSEFLKNATSDDLNKLADKMAQDAPNLLGSMVQLTDKEKATTYIKMNINMFPDMAKNETPDYAKGYIQGLIDEAYIGGLIDETENKDYLNQLNQKVGG